jgi:hypothetical protein
MSGEGGLSTVVAKASARGFLPASGSGRRAIHGVPLLAYRANTQRARHHALDRGTRCIVSRYETNLLSELGPIHETKVKIIHVSE